MVPSAKDFANLWQDDFLAGSYSRAQDSRPP